MLVKIHKSYRDIVAICDSSLVGKKFEQDKKTLEISKNFFLGDELSEEQVLEIIKNYSREDATFNIVGENSIKLTLKAGIISESGIKLGQNIPFALVLL